MKIINCGQKVNLFTKKSLKIIKILKKNLFFYFFSDKKKKFYLNEVHGYL
jgi:hypothetical protein